MFNCKKCKSSLKDSHRYCYGCGAYIGEPVVRADDWQQINNSDEEILEYEYNDEGKIIALHCDKCDAIVEKYHKYCTNCGKSLENNTRIELVEPKNLEEASVDADGEEVEAGIIERYSKKIIYLLRKLFSNKKATTATSILLVLAIVGAYFGRQYFKPEPKYQYDSGYKMFVQDKDWVYYAYHYDYGVKDLSGKKGIYKIKADGNEIVKVSDKPAAFLNLYKNYIYYINLDDGKVYRMEKNGKENEKVSDEEAMSLVVDSGYIYYGVRNAEGKDNRLFRMKLNGSNKKELSKDILSYNIVGDYIYYSSRTSLGDVYRIKTDGSEKTKMCKINGVLRYIRDGYIYYATSGGNPRDELDFTYRISNLNKVKLDGSNPIKLTEDSVVSFLVDKNNNVYYQKIEPEQNIGTGTLYKVNSEGKGKTKLAEKIPPVFYVAKDKAYYIDTDNPLPYRKDFKEDKPLSLLGLDEKAEENFMLEIIKQRTMDTVYIEDFNNSINSGVVVAVSKKDDKENSKVFEVYNTKRLDRLIDFMNAKNRDFINVTKFTKDNSNTNVKDFIQLQYDGKRLMYLTYKKQDNTYKVDKVMFFESINKKEVGNTIKYFLSEKKGDPEDKGLEILNFDKKDLMN